MAECTHISKEEFDRRETYLKSGQRERSLVDPFTWSYRWKTAAFAAGLSILGAHWTNLYTQKPWYYSLYPRMAAISVVAALGYWVGSLRESHNRSRDMVVKHYVETHPKDFERLNDIYGRPYSNVLLPWYPRRTEQKKYD